MSRPAQGNPAANQLVLVLTFGATVALSLALTVFLGRELAPADFGFFALVVAIFAFARDAIDLGSSSTAARDMARDPASERPLLEGLHFARRVIAFALCAGALALAFQQSDTARRWVLLAAAVTLANMGPTAYYALFQARQALVAPALAAFVTQLLLLIGCVAFVMAGAADWSVSALVVAREAILLGAVIVFGQRLIGARVAPRANFERIRSFYVAAGIWAAAILCRHLLVQVDVLSVYLIRGSEELGGWAAAYRILAPFIALPWMVVVPLVPLFAVLSRSRESSELFATTFALGLGAGLIGTACAMIAAPDLVGILYGGKYSTAPLDSVSAMRWLSLAFAPAFLTELAAAGLLVAGRVHVVLVGSATALACKIAANALLVPEYGFVAAAAATGAVEIAIATFLCLSLRLDWRALAGPALYALMPAAIAALLCAAAAQWIATPVVRFAAMCAVGMLALAALMRSGTGREYMRRLRAARAAVAAA